VVLALLMVLSMFDSNAVAGDEGFWPIVRVLILLL
jgi:hypothetical protein